MDGTGLLFDPLLQRLDDFETLVLPLPQLGPQDYKSLSQQIQAKLPKEDDFVLIAESFSGGIASELSELPIQNLRGIIFVASFLSSPRPLLTRALSYLPLGIALKLPLPKILYKTWFFDEFASDLEIEHFKKVLKHLPSKTIRARLRVIAALKYSRRKTADIPTHYLQARGDRLVPPTKLREFQKTFRELGTTVIPGPHFLLQARPQQAADAIRDIVHQLKKDNLADLH